MKIARIKTRYGDGLSRFFYVRFELAGKQHKVSTGCTDERSANAWAKRYVDQLRQQRSAEGLAEVIREIKSGGKKVSLDEAVKRHLAKPSTSKVPNRQQRVRNIWADFCACAADHGIQHIEAITEDVANSWVAHLANTGTWAEPVHYRRKKSKRLVAVNKPKRPLAAKTVNDYRQIAAAIVTSSMKQAGIRDNPFEATSKVSGQANRRHAFSREEVGRVLAIAPPAVGHLVTIAVCTGLRLGDCCRLRWESVDLAGGWIRMAMGKTGAPVRVPIVPRLRTMFAAMPQAGEWVLPEWQAMYETNRSGVSYRIGEALTAAGVRQGPGIRDFHSFRHSFVWQSAEAGIPMPIVQAMVGHLTPAMTRLYADHATDQATMAAVAKLPDPVDGRSAAAPGSLATASTDELLAECRRRGILSRG